MAVSVIIPAYNSASFIAEAVQSVLRQSFQDYELIVVNDGSLDTPDLERELQPYLDRIVYVVQSNTGPSGARNHGIRRARGEYVAFLDSDDVWMPDFLASQMRILKADASLDLVYSNGVIVGDVPTAGRELMSLSPSRGRITFEKLVAAECTVLTTCVVARRQKVIEAGLFDERFRRSEDFHFWSRLAYHGARIDYHRAVLVQHRIRQGSLSEDRSAMAAAAIEALQDLDSTLPLTRVQKELLRRHMASCRAFIALQEGKRLFAAGAYDAAAAALARSERWTPARRAKIRLWLIRLGLRIAPSLLRRTYRLLGRDEPVATGTVPDS